MSAAARAGPRRRSRRQPAPARAGDPALYLKPGREKSLLRRHPWIFSGAVERVAGEPGAGALVEVRSAHGEFLGWAGYSPSSQIVARVLSFAPEQRPGAELFRERVRRALAARAALVPAGDTDAVRLVNAESDGLPGLTVDRYADTLVMQIGAAAFEPWRETLAQILVEETGAAHVLERSDAEVRSLEGLAPRTGALAGDPPERVTIREHGLAFHVDLRHGQKSGFYLDQRDNRRRVARLAAGREVLNGFAYTGAFTAHALAGGAASVLSVEASAEALELARENVRANRLDEARAHWLEGDMFRVLRQLRGEGRRFDLVVLDPPKFAPTAGSVQRAARGYKDINWLAFQLLRPGGLLATFSCSGAVTPDLFQKIVAGAALDAGVDARIVGSLGAAADHPVALEFPEGAYLKGLLVWIGG